MRHYYTEHQELIFQILDVCLSVFCKSRYWVGRQGGQASQIDKFVCWLVVLRWKIQALLLSSVLSIIVSVTFKSSLSRSRIFFPYQFHYHYLHLHLHHVSAVHYFIGEEVKSLRCTWQLSVATRTAFAFFFVTVWYSMYCTVHYDVCHILYYICSRMYTLFISQSLICILVFYNFTVHGPPS